MSNADLATAQAASSGPRIAARSGQTPASEDDAKSLHQEFVVRFRLLGHSKELHRTPFDTIQQFLYCFCRVE